MIRVTVGMVDMQGFLGRDKHPEETDNGKVGVLVSSEEFDSGCGCDPECNDIASCPTAKMSSLTVRFDDGREVELIEHEVASIVVDLA